MRSLIWTIMIGAISGYIAGKIMGFEMSPAKTIVLGVIGSFIGTTLLGMLGFFSYGMIADVIVGVAGACLFIWLAGKFNFRI